VSVCVCVCSLVTLRAMNDNRRTRGY
jgi:hypothetical protein